MKRILLALIFVGIVYQSQESCVPLNQCQSLMWLLRNREDIHNMSRAQVMILLTGKVCGIGIGGMSPKVHCPTEEEEETLTEEEEEDEIPRSGIIEGVETNRSCVGSLKFHNFHKADRTDIQVLISRRRRNRSLNRSLKSRLVFRIQVEGNCCWNVYDRTRFRGSIQRLEAYFDGSPNLQPLSYKQIPCLL